MKKTLALLLAFVMAFSVLVLPTMATESGVIDPTAGKVNFVPVVLQDDTNVNFDAKWIGDWWTATDGSKFVLTYNETEKAAQRSWDGKKQDAGWVKFGYRFNEVVDITNMAAICFDFYISDVDAMNVGKGSWELEFRSPGGDDYNEYRTGKSLSAYYGGELQDGWNHFEIPLSMLDIYDKADDGRGVDLTQISYFRFFNQYLAADAAIGLAGETTTLMMRDIYFVDQLFYERPVPATKEVTDFDGHGVSYSTAGNLAGNYASSVKDVDGDGDKEYAIIDTSSETGDFLIGNGGWFPNSTSKEDPIWNYSGHGVKGPLTFNSAMDTSENITGIMFDIYISDTKIDADASAATEINEDNCVNSLLDAKWWLEVTSYKGADSQEISWQNTFGNIFGQQIETGRWCTVVVDFSTRDSKTDTNGAFVPTNANFLRIYNASAFSYMGDLTIAIDNIRTVRAQPAEELGGEIGVDRTDINPVNTGNGIIWLQDEAMTNGRNKALRVENFAPGKTTGVARDYYTNGFSMDASGMDIVAFDLYVNLYGAKAEDADTLASIAQGVWNNPRINTEISSSGAFDRNEITRKTSLAEMTGSATPVEGWFHVEFPLSSFYASTDSKYSDPSNAAYDMSKVPINYSAISYFTQFMEASITMPEGLGLMFAIDNIYFKNSSYQEPSDEAKASSATLVLNNNFNLNYTVKTGTKIASNPIVELTWNGTTSAVELEARDANTYTFSFNNILAHCMTDTIQTSVCAISYDGKVVKSTHEYSVQEYCERMLAKSDDELGGAQEAAALRKLLSAALRYGAAAQVYASYKTDTLATDGVEGLVEAPDFNINAVQGVNELITGDDITIAGWRSATLVLGNSMAIRCSFTAEDVSDLSVSCSSNTEFIYSGELGIYTSFETATDASGKTYYYFDLPVYADNFGNEIYFVLTTTEGYSVLHYSVNHYIATCYKPEQVKTAALLEAIYNYGVAASSYAGLLMD